MIYINYDLYKYGFILYSYEKQVTVRQGMCIKSRDITPWRLHKANKKGADMYGRDVISWRLHKANKKGADISKKRIRFVDFFSFVYKRAACTPCMGVLFFMWY